MPTVGLFGRSDAAPFPAIRDGFDCLGWRVVWQRVSVWRPADAIPLDAAVMHGTRLNSGAARDYYRERGVPVLVADLPALRVDSYWALWRGAVNMIPAEAPSDRGGILPVSTGRDLGGQVLVCGQKDGDQAHQMDAGELRAYSFRTLHMLREKCGGGREIVWRPHPENPFEVAGFPHSDPRAGPLADALADPELGAVVTYNSTCGLAALAAGVPVWCSAESFYAEAAYHGLPPRKCPPPAPNSEAVRRLLERVGYTQWTEAELATGEPQRFALEMN